MISGTGVWDGSRWKHRKYPLETAQRKNTGGGESGGEVREGEAGAAVGVEVAEAEGGRGRGGSEPEGFGVEERGVGRAEGVSLQTMIFILRI